MINLTQYIIEKLKVNKDTNLYGSDIKNIEDLWEYLKDRYKDIIGGENQTNDKIDYAYEFGLYNILYDKYISNSTKLSYNEWRNQPRGHECATIHFRSLGLETMSFGIFENELICFWFNGFKVSKFEALERIFKNMPEKFEYILNKKSKEPMYNVPLFVYESNDINYLTGLDIIINVIQNFCNEFDVKHINTTIKPGEVLPGWTLDDIKKRYDHVFDNIKMSRTGMVSLGKLHDQDPNKAYYNSIFRIDTKIDWRNGVMVGRRIPGSSGSGNNFVLKPTADEAFDELDNKLRKRGYRV